MNIQQAAGVGGYVTLGERELLLTPLCLEDFGLAQAHLKSKTPDPLIGIAEVCNQVHPEVAKVLMNRAYDEHLRWGSLDTDFGKQWAASADGLAFFAYRMTRAHHPDVTMEWLQVECGKLEAQMLKMVFDKVAEISGLTTNPQKRVKRKPPAKKRK